MVLSIKFSSEDQTALDYRGSQKSFGTVFYYAYTKLEDFKRFFQEMELGKKHDMTKFPVKAHFRADCYPVIIKRLFIPVKWFII